MDELTIGDEWVESAKDAGGGDSSGVRDFNKPFEVLRWVTRECRWAMREKTAYICLYLHRSVKSEKPWPGVRKLAEEMGVSKDVACEAVASLKDLGALTYVERGSDRGSNLYTLLPPWEARQTEPRKPRGRHSVSLKQGLSLKQGQQVSLKQGQGASLKLGHKEPISKEPKVKEPSSKSHSPSAKEQQSTLPIVDTLSEDAQKVTVRFHDLLKSNGHEGIASKSWGAARKIAAGMLSGSGGASSMPVLEAIDALDWGFADAYWRQRLMSQGMKAIRMVWAAWQERDTSRRGKRGYVDPAKDGPEFLDGSPWA